jgi:hypothetical protein
MRPRRAASLTMERRGRKLEAAMPAYILFNDNGVPVRGSVQSSIHLGWSELAAFDLAPSDGESPPMIWLITKTVTPLAPQLSLASARSGGGRGQAFFEPRFSGGVKVGSGLVDGSVRMLSDSVGSTGITAEMDFTSTQGSGELIVLRALVHGVRLVGHAPAVRATS